MNVAVSATTGGIDLLVSALRLRAGGAATGRDLFGALDIRVCAGERWVVIGPNGAGKSSLLAAIAGVFPAAAGDIRIDGRPLSAWRPDALADRRAWSPQFWSDPFPATVRETAVLARDRNFAWLTAGPLRDDPEVTAVLERLDLSRLAEADVQSLSGGERQRVAIATALLQGAPLLLLDEPASHLDPAHQRLLLDVLADHARRGGAVVASLHDLNLAWDLGRHCILLDGRGSAVTGPCASVMTAERLSGVFGVAIETIELRGVRRFVLGAGASSDGR
jgi:iron complex transport system ATP-binding protein